MTKIEINLHDSQADRLVEYFEAVGGVLTNSDAEKLADLWKAMATTRAVIVMSAAVAVKQARGLSS